MREKLNNLVADLNARTGGVIKTEKEVLLGIILIALLIGLIVSLMVRASATTPSGPVELDRTERQIEQGRL